MIANHFSHRLSDLDLRMARHVPPGGNWKDIPTTVPSKRLDQIRTSFAAGEGSRSTYYGRLRPDRPSYTINTYFNRPGNGCFLHYDFAGGQHRTISQREAARLQSFPDGFVFRGSRQAVNKQIGNAVPPLLAFQLALAFPECGRFVDLFCGAGGLSLGFAWAGWQTLVASDVEATFLETHQANIPVGDVICGDLRDPHTIEGIVSATRRGARGAGSGPLIVLGGPPCQGFSTGGKRRSMDDARNQLFQQYSVVLRQVDADAFIFENVPGLLNMEGGAVFRMIADALGSVGYTLNVWTLAAERFGIPQRRTRVFIVGTRGRLHLSPPPATTNADFGHTLFQSEANSWTVQDALSDLPRIEAGEDGSHLDYANPTRNLYQRLMRGSVLPHDYLQQLRMLAAA